jgi:hypothetical protein
MNPAPSHTVSVTIEWRKPWDLFLKLQAWAIVLTVLSVAVLVSSVRAVLTPHTGGRVTIAPNLPEPGPNEAPDSRKR